MKKQHMHEIFGEVLTVANAMRVYEQLCKQDMDLEADI